MKKLLSIVLLVVAGTLGYVVWDWYKFAALTEIDPQRGVYGNDHLEVWIELNKYMPGPAREWGCKTLLERQAKAMGGQGAMPPHTCQADYDPDAKPLGIMESIVQAHVGQADGATDAQKADLGNCIRTAALASLTPEQVEEVNGNSPAAETMSALAIKASEAAQECRAKAGL